MLKHLAYSVTFPSTGRTLSGSYDFSSGLTTITGPNGMGKSLLLEMIRFSFHGTKALRATTDKYKALRTELEFSVKGTDYRVERTLSKATLFKISLSIDTGHAFAGTVLPSKEAVCVGTSAVNTKVAEIFGYGLDVFDTSHVVNQGQIEALGSMRPAERKKMVDNVIGLNVLDDLIKFCGDTAAQHNTEATTLRSMLVEPITPVQPESYTCSTALKLDVEKLQALKTEKDQAVAFIRNEPKQVVWPDDLSITETVEELEEIVSVCEANKNELKLKKVQLAGMHVPSYTMEQLDTWAYLWTKYDLWVGYKKKIDAMPERPSITAEEHARQKILADAYPLWLAKKWEFDRHRIECPECHHAWHEGAADPGPQPEKPMFGNKDEWLAEGKRITAWAAAPSPVTEVACPPLTRQQIALEKKALGQQDEREQLVADIAAFIEPVDRSDDLRVRRAYDTALALASQTDKVWQEWFITMQAYSDRLTELTEVEQELADCHKKSAEAAEYEAAILRYGEDVCRFNSLNLKITEAQGKGEQYGRAKKALVTLKGMIKTHLVPSLSAVASMLVSQMTNGRFTCLQVDEDFNIKLDGQDLDELSGSEKSVANLAVRIGLGQVLTNRVFGVFMGDELDAAMDENRAGLAAECLRALTGKIPQVILVTHKRPEADHYIELGEAA
jgi:DNA repair exonuclease SbcCD ATPase subunit